MIWGKQWNKDITPYRIYLLRGNETRQKKKNEAGEILVTLIEATYDDN